MFEGPRVFSVRFSVCKMTNRCGLSIVLRGELDGGRSPASNEMNSRQSRAEHGFGERRDFFCEYTLSQKNRRFNSLENTTGWEKCQLQKSGEKGEEIIEIRDIRYLRGLRV
jgi:hypothetical protein